MALDHGLLNLPLAKRGDIDAQINAYKRDQAVAEKSARKARAAQLKLDKEAAKPVLAQLLSDVAFINRKAAEMNVTPKALRDQLKSWATWQPKNLIALGAKWLA
ncbi:hypothetical protein [Burkholderia multivorans]|uniref:hypothetical protein n=1 Tax=Burkholderia multivorans TaxID=87883 RepID=UPI0021BE80A1|nr:hypothetical protein [Burkholderia multivorans]MDR8915828.1 hypothetical protein [Burkholderia multivorans]MDR8926435.1 hypothetical protein [Burkholderia multivorans]MDR8964020.1 hypothetical protein [Burkholderia multivorans]MDR8992391.1 hypothetical protein [Burkholderia multivorans]MDR9019198.1 hypothetical protein [Burkholderia multivorans]